MLSMVPPSATPFRLAQGKPHEGDGLGVLLVPGFGFSLCRIPAPTVWSCAAATPAWVCIPDFYRTLRPTLAEWAARG